MWSPRVRWPTAHRFIPLDLSDAQAIDRVVADLPDTLDGLANVAGIAQAPQPQTVVAVPRRIPFCSGAARSLPFRRAFVDVVFQ